MNLLTKANAKTTKGESLGFLTAILYMAPSVMAGRGNVCSFASPECKAVCLYSAGRGKFNNVQKARLRRTNEFFDSPKAFVEVLSGDIAKHEAKAKKDGFEPAIRLNGTSDLPWESLGGNFQKNLMERFPKVQFYDYTKNPNRMKAYLRGEFPKNYHLTFSRSECNDPICEEILKLGGNVAVVFKKDLPKTWNGYKVVEGDKTDLRFLDDSNVIVGLTAKGDAKKIKTNFVVEVTA